MFPVPDMEVFETGGLPGFSIPAVHRVYYSMCLGHFAHFLRIEFLELGVSDQQKDQLGVFEGFL